MKKHIPVMKEKAIYYLRAKEGGVFFDGTVGGGGHTQAILEANDNNFVYGFDKDCEAISFAENALKDFKGRFLFVCDDFRNLFRRSDIDILKIKGFLFDLGVSSFQVEDPERGFSYIDDAPVDMRMDRRQKLKASDVLNGYSFEELKRIFEEYGEINFSSSIAKMIVERRRIKKFETTGELREIIRSKYRRRPTRDVLSRVFQAIRIEVNKELEGLYEFFVKLSKKALSGARIVVITFHSLEDRIVKRAFKDLKMENTIRFVLKKVLKPGRDEILKNKRARSAKMRVVEVI